MSGYDQTIKIKANFYLQGKNFFSFLQAVGRRYLRPVKINYRYLGRGRFYVAIDGGSGSIDALLQELILNRGLYYYICSIRENKKKEILDHVIVPIYRDLLENRFQNPYSKYIKKHILGKILQTEFIPGDFYNKFCHQYEILFRKWDLGLVSESDFIIDIDSFLTQFMLTTLGHKPGEVSLDFDVLVNKVYQHGVGMMRETRKLFTDVHKERKNTLHRLNSISKEKASDFGNRLLSYFQYFDEFQQSQNEKTDRLHGKVFRRIKWGNEKWVNEDRKYVEMESIFSKPCHDCACIKGQYHCSGCDMEICPRCGGQRISCNCKLQKDY